MTGYWNRVYVLRAECVNRPVESVLIFADDDSEATFAAMASILDRAHTDRDSPWAIGAITLTDPQGNIIRTMPSKEQS